MVLKIQNECSEYLEKAIFSFLNFLNEEVETIIWENEAKHQKVFKLKFGHSKLVKKWFWNFFELKNKHCCGVKIAYVIFLEILIDEAETIFW